MYSSTQINKTCNVAFALLLALPLFFITAQASANQELQVIELKHRPAETIIPTLKPLIKTPDSVTATHNKIILNAPAKISAQLISLIEELDQPLKQYWIEVRQGEQQGTSKSSWNTSIRSDHLKISDSHSKNNTGIKTGTNTTTIIRSSTGTKGGSANQQVRALEGYSAYIETGKQIPYYLLSQDGISQSFKPVMTGIYATIHPSGEDHYTIRLSAQKNEIDKQSSRNGSHIKSQSYGSTLHGALGEWINIGGTQRSKSNVDKGVLSRSYTSASSDQALYIKITER